jgi:hypothetical protein
MIARNAIGQRKIPHTSSNALPSPAWSAIAVPSGAPKRIRSSSPARTRPVRQTSTIAISRVFQNGLVSTRSYARLTDLITAPMAPLAAHTASEAPTTNAITEVSVEVSFCSVSIVSTTSFGATGVRNSWSVP